MKKISFLKNHPWEIIGLILTALIIMSLAFTILKSGIPSGHDISAHVIRAQLFLNNLQEGQFPPRWTKWVTQGQEHPLFNFYQSGFYYLVFSVNQIANSLVESIKFTVLGLWWLGAIFVFLFNKRWGYLPAAMASLTFVFTPYIIEDIFVRAAYPELAAIIFSLGTLWALDRLLLTGKIIYAIPLTICFASIILSHLPTLLIVAPLLTGYGLLLFFLEKINPKNLFPVGKSIILALGIASFYFIPALAEFPQINNNQLTKGYYDFHQHFVYFSQLFQNNWGYGISTAGLNDGMSFQFGIIQWLIIFMAIIVLVFYKISHKKTVISPYLIFWIISILITVFFMDGSSVSFWENIKPLSFIQYPWRLLLIVAISCSSLAGLLTTLLTKEWQKFLILCGLILTIYFFYLPYLTPAAFLPENYFSSNPGSAHLEEGYLPISAKELSEPTEKRWSINSQAQVKENTSLSNHLQLETNSIKPETLTINIPSFPGWIYYLDKTEIKPDNINDYGFVNLSIPAGKHQAEAVFTNTLIRTIANSITAVSLFVLLVWLGFGAAKRLNLIPKK